MTESEGKINDIENDELAKQTAKATWDFLPQLQVKLGKTDQEATHALKQNIELIENNLSLFGVREALSPEQQQQIDQELKNAKIKLKYFGGSFEEKL